MARHLVIGNGKMLLNLDQHCYIRDIYYPFVGQLNHVGGQYCRLGVWVEGAFSWLDEPEWKFDLDYIDDSLVTNITAKHDGLGIELHMNDGIHQRECIYIKRVVIRNRTNDTKEVRLFFHQDLMIDGSEVGDTAVYYPENHTLYHYKRNNYFMFNGFSDEGGMTQYSTGIKRFQSAEGTWRDAEDGVLMGNSIAQGSVDSTISFRTIVAPNSDKSVYYWMSIGQNLEEVKELNQYVQDNHPEKLLSRMVIYWKHWLRRAETDLGDLPHDVVKMFKQSLLLVRTQVDERGAALLASALPRARALLADGVTTIEIKSGYGLDTTTELKMLRVARRIGVELGVGVRTTFLGAHALPPEFNGRADDYITLVCEEMLPAMVEHGLADAVDGFCETIGFSPAQIRRVFERARALGLPLKLHAEQLSYQGGARLAAEYGALSADHVEHATDACARAMAQAGTVAVLLPGAYLCMRETLLPPIDSFRAHGVAMAVATDCNPGTSPLLSLRLALGLACAQFRLTPIEALRGATVNAAKALGLDDRGVLVPGKRADMVRWNVRAPAELCYWLGGDPVRDVWLGGQRVPAGTQARRA